LIFFLLHSNIFFEKELGECQIAQNEKILPENTEPATIKFLNKYKKIKPFMVTRNKIFIPSAKKRLNKSSS